MKEYYYYKKYNEESTDSVVYELKLFPIGFMVTSGINWDHKELEISFLDTIRVSVGITNPF